MNPECSAVPAWLPFADLLFSVSMLRHELLGGQLAAALLSAPTIRPCLALFNIPRNNILRSRSRHLARPASVSVDQRKPQYLTLRHYPDLISPRFRFALKGCGFSRAVSLAFSFRL